MKVFISQVMRGLTDEEILKTREEAIKFAKATIDLSSGDTIEIIDSFFQSAPAEAKPLWFLGKSLELLSTADVCLFVGDWGKTHEVAELSMNVVSNMVFQEFILSN